MKYVPTKAAEGMLHPMTNEPYDAMAIYPLLFGADYLHTKHTSSRNRMTDWKD